MTRMAEKILLTGATGFLGSAILNRLSALPDELLSKVVFE
jgi:nucleoside-diphosphate-sugar epimerase